MPGALNVRIWFRAVAGAVVLLSMLVGSAAPGHASVALVDGPRVPLPTGAGAVHTGDLNGDKATDVVVGTGSRLWIALGDGKGGFLPPHEMSDQGTPAGCSWPTSTATASWTSWS